MRVCKLKSSVPETWLAVCSNRIEMVVWKGETDLPPNPPDLPTSSAAVATKRNRSRADLRSVFDGTDIESTIL